MPTSFLETKPTGFHISADLSSNPQQQQHVAGLYGAAAGLSWKSELVGCCETERQETRRVRMGGAEEGVVRWGDGDSREAGHL